MVTVFLCVRAGCVLLPKIPHGVLLLQCINPIAEQEGSVRSETRADFVLLQQRDGTMVDRSNDLLSNPDYFKVQLL